MLSEIIDPMSPADRKDLIKTEARIGDYCEKPPSEKEAKLCYYVDPIKREISQPIKNGVPYGVVCQRLKKKSAEICALKYSATAAVAITRATDLSKLKVKDLKGFIMEKNVACAGCTTKDELAAAITKWFEERPQEL